MAKKSQRKPVKAAPGGTGEAPEGGGDEVLQDVERFLDEMEGLASPLADVDAVAGELAGKETEAEKLQARWIAEGLGRPVADLKRVVAGPEAGEDSGQVFYGVQVEGGELLVRADGLRTYLRNVSLEKAREAQTAKVLADLNLVSIAVEAPGKGHELQAPWVRVAQGQSPAAGKASQIEFYCPNQPEERLSFQALSLLSAELHQLFGDRGFDQHSLPSLRGMAVATGQVLARVSGGQAGQAGQDVFGRSLAPPLESPQGRVETGWQVSLSEAGEYRAERSGYLCLADGRLSVLPPIWLDKDEMHAYWVLLDEHPHPLTVEMVHQCLSDAGVVAGIQEESIVQLVFQVQSGQHQVGLCLLAQGRGPVNGQDARVEILVDLQRRAGTEKPDGSIDFREVNFAPSVGVGQVIARRRPPVVGTPGHDVRGNPLEAREGKDQPLQAGSNVEVRLTEGVEVYAATIEGVVKQIGDELRVIRQLALKGDIDFGTGNLDFRGEVYIDGSVVQGFSVKATGTITITNTVENGSTVLSAGDIVVGRGILGRRTRVQAGGSVRAQFIQEARVEAGGDITVGNYVYHALLRAEGKVVVHKGAGSRGGGILGGEAWGREGVEAFQLGSPNGVTGTIVVGLQPGQAQQLDRIKASAGTCQEHIQKLLHRFNLSRIDLAQIRNMVAAATGPHRKVLVHHAQQLGQLVQLYQKLQGEQAALEDRIRTAVKGAAVKVHDLAFLGVTIRIGEYQRKLREDVKSPRFHIHEGRLVER
ncbi:MAG: DUF342 domain-containing protein [Candidatus Latescibacteria bacterium]|nr:DUF342 domain-containing protein [Candidatus Latescibacterota bacterium]